jgi:hypothetical protein
LLLNFLMKCLVNRIIMSLIWLPLLCWLFCLFWCSHYPFIWSWSWRRLWIWPWNWLWSWLRLKIIAKLNKYIFILNFRINLTLFTHYVFIQFINLFLQMEWFELWLKWIICLLKIIFDVSGIESDGVYSLWGLYSWICRICLISSLIISCLISSSFYC